MEFAEARARNVRRHAAETGHSGHSMHRMDLSRTSYGYVDTPLGRLLLVGSNGALTGLYFDGSDRTPRLDPASTRDDASFDTPRRRLDEYFDGRRASFDLDLAPQGTAFQRAMWRALLDVPCGETTTYGELARALRRPLASRAVGAANGANPISIVIPCHRVVGANGGLTGYGWGLDRKAWLLDHERAMAENGVVRPR